MTACALDHIVFELRRNGTSTHFQESRQRAGREQTSASSYVLRLGVNVGSYKRVVCGLLIADHLPLTQTWLSI